MMSTSKTELRSWHGIGLAILLAAAGIGRDAEARWAPAAKPSGGNAWRQKAFDEVWTKVRDSHYDPKLGGLDWVAVRKKYLPAALKAPTNAEFYQTLNNMLGELKQSHLAVAAPFDPLAPPSASGGPADPGITIQWVENLATITEVDPQGPGAAAGLKPGMAVVAVDGKPMEPLIATMRQRVEKKQLRELAAWVTLNRLADRMVSGAPGSRVKLRVREVDGTEREIESSRSMASGPLAQFGNLPPFPAKVTSRRLPENVGLIQFNIFLIPNLEPVQKAIREFHDTRAIILDVRGNPGGIGAMASGVCRLFYDKQSTLGVMKLRSGEINFAIFPEPDPYRGQVVVLTNELSLSTSEILAGGLQETKRGIVVGRPTGGMVLPSQVVKLTGGASLQYVMGDFRTPSGVLLEGRGVTPDVPVTFTRRELASGKDLVLEAALKAISERAGAPTG